MPATKFSSADREKAWTNYHREYLRNMDLVIAVTESPSFAVVLCLKLFERLLQLNYPTPANPELEERSQDISEQDVDVINYVGGGVVKELKTKLYRLKPSGSRSKQQKLLCQMCTTVPEKCRSLTKTLSRGGLSVLSANAKDFFRMVEIKFRDACKQPEQNKCTYNDFEKMCSLDKEVTCMFEQVFNSVTEDEDEHAATSEESFDNGDDDCDSNVEKEKLKVFRDIVVYYFKVRVHHECKLFMDRYRCKRSIEKAQKGTRRTLKCKVSTD